MIVAGDRTLALEHAPEPPPTHTPSSGQGLTTRAAESKSPQARCGETRQGPRSSLPAHRCCELLTAALRSVAARKEWRHPRRATAGHGRMTASLIALDRKVSHTGKERRVEMRLLVSQYLLLTCHCALACPTLFGYAIAEDRCGIWAAVDDTRAARGRRNEGAG
jgi:hypothetical protein